MGRIVKYILVFAIGALIGSILGELIGSWFAPESTFYNVFTKSVEVGIKPPWSIDLKILEVTFGFILKLNFLSLVGIIAGLIFVERYFKS
ncbi:MAG: DUF4321 domain-containing protein [bacterium]|nr:DUF4321 domain-containing protein [bacterium]